MTSQCFTERRKRNWKPYYPIVLLMVLFIPVLLGSCNNGSSGGGNDQGNGGPPVGGTPEFSIGAKTDRTGRASAQFTIPASTTKLAITASISGGLVRFIDFSNSLGISYLFPNNQIVSLAAEFSPFINTLVAPSRDFDLPLATNVPYSAAVLLTSANGRPVSGEDIVFNVYTRNDENLGSGRLALNVFTVGAIGNTSENISLVDQALSEMLKIMGDQAKINLSISRFSVDGPASLPVPVSGSSFYESISSLGPSPSVNLVIGADIANFGGEVLGISAGIPGPPAPSELSAVAISLIAGVGPDGVASNSEILLLGETFAHEVGHFMGLFHPVELGEVTTAGVDPLVDTPECLFVVDCFNNAELTRNLMFPTPITDSTGNFIRQNRLTSQQRGVLNRYIAVD